MTKRVNADEQYKLILECRSSGLTDYQWCKDHGINLGTFYNWVKRLRKKPAMIYRLLQAAMISDRGKFKRLFL